MTGDLSSSQGFPASSRQVPFPTPYRWDGPVTGEVREILLELGPSVGHLSHALLRGQTLTWGALFETDRLARRAILVHIAATPKGMSLLLEVAGRLRQEMAGHELEMADMLRAVVIGEGYRESHHVALAAFLREDLLERCASQADDLFPEESTHWLNQHRNQGILLWERMQKEAFQVWKKQEVCDRLGELWRWYQGLPPAQQGERTLVGLVDRVNQESLTALPDQREMMAAEKRLYLALLKVVRGSPDRADFGMRRLNLLYERERRKLQYRDQAVKLQEQILHRSSDLLSLRAFLEDNRNLPLVRAHWDKIEPLLTYLVLRRVHQREVSQFQTHLTRHWLRLNLPVMRYPDQSLVPWLALYTEVSRRVAESTSFTGEETPQVRRLDYGSDRVD